jgi:hypothetical protein
MFEGEYELTFEEEASIEQPANIYSIIRTLDFIVCSNSNVLGVGFQLWSY